MACGDSYSIWFHSISDITPLCHGGKPGSTPGGIAKDFFIYPFAQKMKRLSIPFWGDFTGDSRRTLGFKSGQLKLFRNMGLKVTGELLPRVATFEEQINSLFILVVQWIERVATNHKMGVRFSLRICGVPDMAFLERYLSQL